ncbi:MAG: putative 2OG-Fe(II) oxygenase [Parvularculaceae bacterium]
MFELERNPAFVDRLMRGTCGTKVRHIEQWDCAAASLIHARASELFRRTLKTADAVVDDCWGNIYRRNDYCMPHSHMRATASVVYFLDAGDDSEAGDRLAGKFYIADPRLRYCTPYLDGHMTRVLVPNSQAGSMIIFPGYILHGVNPYLGERPRLSLSWNINQRAIEGAAAETFRETTGVRPN